MMPQFTALGAALIALSVASSTAFAQRPDSARMTGGLALGLSGMRSADGTTVAADVMWVGAEMNDGIGLRFLRQGLSPRTHGYAAMLVIGGPPHDSISWLRIDFGMGYVGQQSDRPLSFFKRHGIGAQFGATVAPWRLGIVRPELNGWGVVGTSAQFLGAALGLRILDPRQR
jgi:hypothetical protein